MGTITILLNPENVNKSREPTVKASKMPFPDLLYYNMMTPAWLSDPKNKADWRRANTKTFEDLRVIIGPDTLPYERICTIPLLPGSFFAKAAENRNITVKIMVGMELPNTTMEVVDGKTTALDMPTKAADPLAILLTDGNKGIGVVLQDVTQDHEIAGPYYQIQGNVGPSALNDVTTKAGQQLARTSGKNNPDEFRITLKPTEHWGEAYSAIDGGHKSLFYYNETINLVNGLNLQLCRIDPAGTFNINYIEVSVFGGAPPPS